MILDLKEASGLRAKTERAFGGQVIKIHRYGETQPSINWFTDCAMPIAGKTLAVLCLFLTRGGRHG